MAENIFTDLCPDELMDFDQETDNLSNGESIADASNSESKVNDFEVEESRKDAQEEAGIAEMEEESFNLEMLQEESRKIEAAKAEIREMEESLKRSCQDESPLETNEIDERSIYIGNVDYSTQADELEEYFCDCGPINRITIPTNTFTSRTRGFAYLEFSNKDSVSLAMALDDTLFKGRALKVLPKRTNLPGISTTNRPPRGRGSFRGSRGYFPNSRSSYRGFRGSFRGHRGSFRGTSRSFHAGFGSTQYFKDYRRDDYYSPY